MQVMQLINPVQNRLNLVRIAAVRTCYIVPTEMKLKIRKLAVSFSELIIKKHVILFAPFLKPAVQTALDVVS